jgi:hypothetical protein
MKGKLGRTLNPFVFMNRFTFSALLAAATLSVTAFAQTTATPATPPAPPRPDAPGTPINPEQTTPVAAPAEPAAQVRELVFAEADTDKDGRVSLTEYSNFVESRVANRSVNPLSEQTIERFRQLDQDNDAFLSPSEAATVQQQPPAQVSPGTPPRTGN